ncbi:MAG: hypothetical protein HDR02_12935 [Lachnospiraceae bacterium]|nr:hypothetical protein [Lachnospiraceae bacterium]
MSILYLKINRNIEYTIRNLRNWIRIAMERNDKCFLVCDAPELKSRVIREMDFGGCDIEWLESIRSEQAQGMISHMANERWANAGYAHLTTFLHAAEHGYDSFWNIDADDTVMCLDYAKAAKVLSQVEEYAKENEIDVFSLDMWRTQSRGNSWSFGITYTNGKLDWPKIFYRNFDYRGMECRSFVDRIAPKNIDEFFAYLREHDKNIKIETFCVMNLLFVHYSDDFLFHPIQSGIYTWIEDEMRFPILEYVFGVPSLGRIPIAQDVVRMECDIMQQEGRLFLAEIANYTFESGNVLDAREYDLEVRKQVGQQLEQRINDMLLNYDLGDECYLFGCNEFAESVKEKLEQRGIVIKGILDNDKGKQNREYAGLMVFAPETIKTEKLERVGIIVISRHYRNICFQLKRYGYQREPYWLTDYRTLLQGDGND